MTISIIQGDTMLQIICTLIVAIITPVIAVFAYREIIEIPRNSRSQIVLSPDPRDVKNDLKIRQIEDVLISARDANYSIPGETLIAIRAIIEPENTFSKRND
jgi:hypothetical protein